MLRPAHLLALAVSLCAASAAAVVDFAREVQPILAENCLHFHGPDAADRKAGLRLDTREGALKGGKSGVATIVEHKPADSELIARLLSTDEEEMMPPPKEKKTLTASQKDTLTRWIAEGAPYAAHWAFTAPVKAPLPLSSPLPRFTHPSPSTPSSPRNSPPPASPPPPPPIPPRSAAASSSTSPASHPLPPTSLPSPPPPP